VSTAVEHVGADQTAEQQAFRSQEEPHPELVVRQPGRRVVGVVSVTVPLAMHIVMRVFTRVVWAFVVHVRFVDRHVSHVSHVGHVGHVSH
jgi:hypothetical protein